MTLRDSVLAWLSLSSEKTAQAPAAPSPAAYQGQTGAPAANVAEDPPVRRKRSESAGLSPAEGNGPEVPPGLRSLTDPAAARAAIYENVLDAVRKRFPIENDSVRLELSDARYDGPQSFTLEQQKHALMTGRRLRTPIKGTWRLFDKATGKLLDEREDSVLQVPYYTDRGTVINNGNDYTVVNQMRLLPGVYTRRKQNGELESQFNVANGKGFRIGLDPSTGIMNVSVGQAHVPLYPIMRAIGITDDQIAKSWGADVALANSGRPERGAVQGFYKRIAGYGADPLAGPETQGAYIREALSGYGLDPGVIERTLGIRGVSGVTPEVLLRASQKLLNVNRGDEEPDNRDAPRFSRFYGIEDTLRERIDKDSGRLTRNLLMKASRDRSLGRIQRNALSPYFDAYLSGSRLAMPGEEANPISILTQQGRITKMGEGGISSPDRLTEDAKFVQGDFLGYVDPLAGPESSAVGADVRASYGTMKGSDHRLYNQFVDMRTGKTRYVALDDAADHVVAFPGQDPGSPYLFAMKGNSPAKVPREEVDYMVPSTARMFSSGINLNPMPTANQGARQFYAAKFWEQMLPQKKGETPLVDTLMPDGSSTFTEYYGRQVGCLSSPVDGTVVKADDKGVVVKDATGARHTVDLVKNLPFNRLSAISYFPCVKPGDSVTKGGMVANSNFTDPKTGSLNMGQNLKVAVISGPGSLNSYEDSQLISESAARRLSTSRLYGYSQDYKDGVISDRSRYLAAFPQKFTKQQAETLDASGVVKTGTVLNKGDPIIAAIGPKVLSAGNAQLGRLSSVLKNALTDKSQTWEHDWPGTVVDTASTPSGVCVNIVSEPPVSPGDKLSGRFGLKGVVATVIPDDRMPRDSATNQPFDMLVNPMGFLSRVAPGQMMEIALGKLAKSRGSQIRIPQDPPPEGWLAWTKAQLAAGRVPETTDVFDPVSGRTVKGIGDGYMYVQAFHHLSEKKFSARDNESAYTQDEQPAKGGEEGSKRFCLVGSQKIDTSRGPRTIASVVSGREPVEAFTRLSDGTWGTARVTGWFSRKGKASEVVTLSFSPVSGSRPDRVSLSGNHEVYMADGSKKPASAVKPGDWAMSYGKRLSREQWETLFGLSMAIGSVSGSVGGGSLILRHSFGRGFSSWVSSSFRGCCSPARPSGKLPGGHAFRRRDISAAIESMLFRSGRRSLRTADLLSIGPSALAAWAMCSMEIKPGCSGRGYISARGFTAEETARLARWVSSRTGQDCRPCREGDSRAVSLTPEAVSSVSCMIARIARPSSLPSGRGRLSGTVSMFPSCFRGVRPGETGDVPVQALSSARHRAKGEIDLYDITVDGCHRYCASGILVSNSGFDQRAVLSYGAPEVLKDAITLRGQKNEEYWRKLRLGLPVQEPGVPFIYSKFMNTLRAGGINVVEKGDVTKIMPQTDADTDAMCGGRYLDNSQMVDADLRPVRGGLFDLSLTGGAVGNRWSAIRLPEPVPNPVMEEPVRRVLGLTVKGLEDVLAGRRKLGGLTGGEAVSKALGAVDPDAVISRCRDEIRNKRGAARDNAVKVLGYMKAAKDMGMKPSSWMITKVPVLPPIFRPVSRAGDVMLTPDMNVLYKELMENSDNFASLKKDLPDDQLADERLNIYMGVKAAYGLGPSITREGQAKNLKGAVRQIIGSVPKFGMVQSKVLAKTQDLVGRGVIIPDQNLDMDQIGIPEDMAWRLYRPFVIRSLVRRGFDPADSLQKVENRDGAARSALEEEMSRRPVLMDRAPTWHKFNIMALVPHIVDGKSIHVSPLDDKAMNGDHDGDAQCGRVFFVIRGISKKKDGSYRSRSGLKLSRRLILFLNSACWYGKLSRMQRDTRIFALSKSDLSEELFVSDLADFPHGDKVSTVEGKNGPIDFYRPVPGTMVLSMGGDGRLRLAEVSGWSFHPGRKLEIVTLDDSSQIHTDDDPRAVFGLDPLSGGLELSRDTPSNAMSRKMLVPCVKDTGVMPDSFTSGRVRIAPDGLPFSETALDFGFGWLLGALCGDGWWDRKDYSGNYRQHGMRDIMIADAEGDNSSAAASELFRLSGGREFSHFVRDYPKRDGDGRYGSSSRHSFRFSGSTEFSEFLSESMGGEGGDGTSGSANKRLPAFAFSAPYEFRKGLLCGLIDTDGSVSVNRSTGRPRLSVNFSTTSHRLARDFRELCRTLGVGSYVCAGKTPLGKPCYSAYPYVSNLKSGGLLDGLRCARKRKAFLETGVSLSCERRDSVAVPAHVAAAIMGRLSCRCNGKGGRKDPLSMALGSGYVSLWKACFGKDRTYLLPRRELFSILCSAIEEESRVSREAADAKARLSAIASADGILSDGDRLSLVSSATSLLPCKAGSREMASRKSFNGFLMRWMRKGLHFSELGKQGRKWLEWMEGLNPPASVLEDPAVSGYLSLISDPNVSWRSIKSVEKTGMTVDGYDLTVPGSETFVSSEGIVLSNTVNIHLPASEKAVSQAMDKMRPSRNLFSLTDLKSMRYKPEQEQVSGLWFMTRGMSGKAPRRFASKEDAVRAYRSGEISYDDPVEIG